MITIDLNEFSAEDFKYIKELKNMGLPDDLIQIGYNNTQEKRKKENVNGRG